MKVSDFVQYINKEAGYKINGLVFKIRILDVKTGYNSVFMLVEPLDPGTGNKSIWVSENSIKFN